MHAVRVELECGDPARAAAARFSTLVLVTAEEFAAGEHEAEAAHRAAVMGYPAPFRVARSALVAASTAPWPSARVPDPARRRARRPR